ncbi:MAG: ATP-grasp domain-containing protein [Promethearchaeota archaeon]
MNNKIFIFEFVSGGGFNNTIIPTSLFCEGFGMLRSITADFKLLDFEIYTTLDYRISFLSKFIKADHILNVRKNENSLKTFKDCVMKCKYVFIIAPETLNILYNLTEIVKKSGKIILSTNLRGIKYGSSKIISHNIFNNVKISTPKTYRIPFKEQTLDLDFIIHKFRELKCPIVIKPEDGVGAESINYFENESQILNFYINFEQKLEKKRNYIIQQFISGSNLSMSIIGSPNLFVNPLILSINSQNINITDKTPEYLGGYTPLENYKDIINQLTNTIEKLKNLNIEGYFGIDFIEDNNKLFTFIEINPRLTTSYIGLRNILNFNCAELIFNSRIKNISKFEIDLKYYSYFTRIDFYYNFVENMEFCKEKIIPKLIKLIPEFVTPPISFNDNKYSCFVATKTTDLASSKIKLNEIIKSLEKFNFNIVKPKKPIL